MSINSMHQWEHHFLSALDRCHVVAVSPRRNDLQALVRCAPYASILACEDDFGRSNIDLQFFQALESATRIRQRFGADDVKLLSGYARQIATQQNVDAKKIFIVPYSASEVWDKLAREWPHGMELLSASSALVRRLNDKPYMRLQVSQLGIPAPPSLTLQASEITYGQVASKLGDIFVLQVPMGSAGRGTYLVRDSDELERVLLEMPQIPRWLLTRYAGDVAINATGVAYNNGVHLAWPSLQISGIDSLGVGFGAYCGSDFAVEQSLSARARHRLSVHVNRIGQWLSGIGYRGIFGVDFIINGDEINFLELNPRVQASSALLANLELMNFRMPTLVHHVLALLGQSMYTQCHVEAPIVPTSQLVIRWNKSESSIADSPRSGTYRLARGTLTYEDESDQVDISDPSAFVISGAPAPNTRIAPGAALARVTSTRTLTDSTGHALTPIGQEVIKATRALFSL